MRKTNNIAVVIGVYYAALFAVWLLVEWIFQSNAIAVSDQIGHWLIQGGIKEGALKILIWLIPAVGLMHTYKSRLYVSPEDMIRNKVNWIKILPIFLAFTIYLVGGAYDIFDAKLAIARSFVWPQLLLVLSVGITEEMVFRGLLLNVTIKDAPGRMQWAMVALNGILFLSIHLPIWFLTDQLGVVVGGFGFLSVIALSFIFSWTFIKTKSILPAIALHTYWNLLMVLFYGA